MCFKINCFKNIENNNQGNIDISQKILENRNH